MAALSSLESFNPHSHLSRSPQNGQTQVQFSIGFLQSSQIVNSSLVLSELIVFLLLRYYKWFKRVITTELNRQDPHEYSLFVQI